MQITEKHTVKLGESLWNISEKYGTTVDELKKINNLHWYFIFPGQKLKIPSKTQESKRSMEVVTHTKSIIYTIKEKETLEMIATIFGVTVHDIIEINGLQTEELVAGEEILIPKNDIFDSRIQELDNIKFQEVSGLYIVKKGDTLTQVAQQFGITKDNLKQSNNLQEEIIEAGEEILIPRRVNNRYVPAI